MAARFDFDGPLRCRSKNGLANAQMVVGLNGGAHANPLPASGDTNRAWTRGFWDKARYRQTCRRRAALAFGRDQKR